MKIGVIGAGIVGLSVTRDLALRGLDCILIEQGVPGCGTTTLCAGMLHSGARYAVQEPELAKLCAQANKELKELVPFAIDGEEGLFVSLESDPSGYAQEFAEACHAAGISTSWLSRHEVHKLEPTLGPKVSGAFLVPDAIVNSQLLVDAYVAELTRLGVDLRIHHKFLSTSHSQSRIWQLKIQNLKTKKVVTMPVDGVINAAGPWAAEVAEAFAAPLDLNYIHGSMAILEHRLFNRVISRCALPSAGDVLIPFANHCLVGSTWHELSHNEPIKMSSDDLTTVIETGRSIVPAIAGERVVRTFTGIRVHLASLPEGKTADFLSTRNFTIIDHRQKSKVNGLVTALGGKLVLGRYVAEKAIDLLLNQFGIKCPCQTKTLALKPPKKKIKK